MSKKFEFYVYKHEKIEVYSEYIKYHEDDPLEYLAEDILDNLDIEYYQIENVQINPYENPNPHMLIEYTIELNGN